MSLCRCCSCTHHRGCVQAVCMCVWCCASCLGVPCSCSSQSQKEERVALVPEQMGLCTLLAASPAEYHTSKRSFELCKQTILTTGLMAGWMDGAAMLARFCFCFGVYRQVFACGAPTRTSKSCVFVCLVCVCVQQGGCRQQGGRYVGFSCCVFLQGE